jgi:hypothetical protein
MTKKEVEEYHWVVSYRAGCEDVGWVEQAQSLAQWRTSGSERPPCSTTEVLNLVKS